MVARAERYSLLMPHATEPEPDCEQCRKARSGYETRRRRNGERAIRGAKGCELCEFRGYLRRCTDAQLKAHLEWLQDRLYEVRHERSVRPVEGALFEWPKE